MESERTSWGREYAPEVRTPPPHNELDLATNKVFAWTPEDYKVSELLQGYFANFIKTGDPNGPGLPEWPAAGVGDSVRTMVLAIQPHVDPEPHRDAYQILDRFFSPTSEP